MPLPEEVRRCIGRIVDVGENARAQVFDAEIAPPDGSRRTEWYWAKYI